MTGRPVLVTGAYGLLGRWLVEALLAEGARVAVLRRDRVPQAALVLDGLQDRCVVVDGDVTDGALLERALGRHEVEVVFHLAAQTIVGTARRSPVATFEANVRGTWLLLEACRRVGVGAVVVAASDKAYGPADDVPYTEEHPLRPTAPYDVSKACADLVARSYFHAYGLPVATTRFANLYGGGDLNRSRLVPEAVAAALAGRAPVIRSDGTPERDFLAAEDAAAAYLAIARALLDPAGGARGEAFNAGGDRPHSVLEVVDAVCRAAGADVRPDVRGTGTPDGEIDRQWVDSSRLRALTGWRPLVDLEEGLHRTVAWYRSHPGVLG
ncbi:MAG TPA: NAD-dependent epimerase/dehydratase family protein [Solirubrobacteraceae bacterium]|nr:NAD-dependent epimerase/dehydratase family protein [Solirubrobacteraceae bacterium]